MRLYAITENPSEAPSLLRLRGSGPCEGPLSCGGVLCRDRAADPTRKWSDSSLSTSTSDTDSILGVALAWHCKLYLLCHFCSKYHFTDYDDSATSRHPGGPPPGICLHKWLLGLGLLLLQLKRLRRNLLRLSRPRRNPLRLWRLRKSTARLRSLV